MELAGKEVRSGRRMSGFAVWLSGYARAIGRGSEMVVTGARG